YSSAFPQIAGLPQYSKALAYFTVIFEHLFFLWKALFFSLFLLFSRNCTQGPGALHNTLFLPE
ncbi:MAG: hypothetical protein ABUK19_07540, partial [Desulfobacteria bacterium]